MRTRAAVILLQDDALALIERHRAGLHYFVLPGGGVQPGETPAQAAEREAWEELGVRLVARRLVISARLADAVQEYFLAGFISGVLGTGTGEEMTAPTNGTYLPRWVPLADLPALPLQPAFMLPLLIRFLRHGFPAEPFHCTE